MTQFDWVPDIKKDLEQLERHMDAFPEVPDDWIGLRKAQRNKSITQEQKNRIFDIWTAQQDAAEVMLGALNTPAIYKYMSARDKEQEFARVFFPFSQIYMWKHARQHWRENIDEFLDTIVENIEVVEETKDSFAAIIKEHFNFDAGNVDTIVQQLLMHHASGNGGDIASLLQSLVQNITDEEEEETS